MGNEDNRQKHDQLKDRAEKIGALTAEYNALWTFYIHLTNVWEVYAKQYFALVGISIAVVSAIFTISEGESGFKFPVETLFSVFALIFAATFVTGLAAICMLVVEIANSHFYHQSIKEFRARLLAEAGIVGLQTIAEKRAFKNKEDIKHPLFWFFRLHLICLVNSIVLSTSIIFLTYGKYTNRNLIGGYLLVYILILTSLFFVIHALISRWLYNFYVSERVG